jgi:hypothetical protein
MCIVSSITYRSDLHFAIDCHRSLLGGVHSKDCGLGKVNDRSAHHRAKNSAAVDGEGTAGHVLDGKLIVASLLPKFCNSLFDLIISMDSAFRTTGVASPLGVATATLILT